MSEISHRLLHVGHSKKEWDYAGVSLHLIMNITSFSLCHISLCINKIVNNLLSSFL